jgi:uncharacterized membrane protein YcaP (DUF421 family)
MAARAAVMFLILLVMIRVAGVRSFGRKSSFDNVLVIMLGAVAARGVVGASPFGSTVAACAALVVLHRVLGRFCVSVPWLSKLIEGEPVPLLQDGRVLDENLKRTNISRSDLLESRRLERQSNELTPDEEAVLERNGRISFVVPKEKRR